MYRWNRAAKACNIQASIQMLIMIQQFSAQVSRLTSRGKVADTCLADTWKRATKEQLCYDTTARKSFTVASLRRHGPLLTLRQT